MDGVLSLLEIQVFNIQETQLMLEQVINQEEENHSYQNMIQIQNGNSQLISM